MTQSRCWTFVAVLSVALAVSGSRAGVPDCCKGKCSSGKKGTTSATMIQKTYPVADLVVTMSKDPAVAATSLTQTIVKTINPKSWSDKGGSGTIKYMPKSKTLVVRQTSTVHKQVGCMLKALACAQPAPKTTPREISLVSGITPAGSLPADLDSKSPPPGNAKQYGHFVMDNVKVNAMGVSCSVKSIRFMYRGDGLDNEVAKCAMTGGESEAKKNELPKAVTDLLEKLGQKDKPSCCASGNCCCCQESKCSKTGCCATGCCNKEGKTEKKTEEKKTEESEQSIPDDDN